MGHGGERVKRVENLNGNEKFIGALADLASAQLRGGARCSTRMGLRYQECRSEGLRNKKSFLQERLTVVGKHHCYFRFPVRFRNKYKYNY